MGPKKAFTAKEAEEIKRSLDFLSGEIAAMRKQQRDIPDLAGEIKVLRMQSEEKDKRIIHLESRVSDLEQYTRINNVIVTGLHVKPRSYARAVNDDNGGEPGEMDVSSTEQQVAAFLQSKGIDLDCNAIEACHPLPRRKTSDNPVVIIRFVNRKHKTALLRQGRKLKGSNVFLNDHLTKYNAVIARIARNLKRQRKIQNTWTANCKMFIQLNGSPEVLVVKHIEELDKYQ